MDRNNILLLLFFLLFVLPDSPKNGNAEEKLDTYVAMAYEGETAVLANRDVAAPTPPAPTPPEVVTKCECGGTGKIKMPDGNYIECKCGPECSCKKNKGTGDAPAPITEDVKKKILPHSPFPPLKAISTI